MCATVFSIPLLLLFFFLTWSLGVEIGSSCFPSKNFTDQSISPVCRLKLVISAVETEVGRN